MRTRFFVPLLLLLAGLSTPVLSQVSARLFQHPDVSRTQIAFAYAGDIWVVPRDGGLATRLSSPRGAEEFPKFSPDGQSIAFSANYEGNTDVYVLPVQGGVPRRLTYHGMPDRILDWHPDGKSILLASLRESGRDRFSQLYTVSAEGGLAAKLPIPYGEFAAFSPDGKKIAYTLRTTAFRTWKRYRGGMGAHIWVFDLATHAAERITSDPASDELPMWAGSTIYFLSDRGQEERMNLWAYDLMTKNVRQLTRFTDTDVHWPSLGPTDIVFEAGGKLYLFDLATQKQREVSVSVVTDLATLTPSVESTEALLQSATVSHDGKRAVIEARGDVFSVPAEHGAVRNLTRTPGVAERSPAWSPDGRTIAYWSDRTGEYELTVRDADRPETERTLTSYGPGFRYALFWAPNSKKIAFIDEGRHIRIYDVERNATSLVDRAPWIGHGGLAGFRMSWSSDSRWLAYARSIEYGNANQAIFLYDTREGKTRQVTSGYYGDASPSFDPEGKYLFFLTDRSFTPIYGGVDNSFLYANLTRIAAASLRNDVPSPVAARNDTVALVQDAGARKDEKKDDKKDEKKEEAKKKPADVTIALDGFEGRVVLLPPEAGNYQNLQASAGKLVYLRTPNTGASEKTNTLKYYDLQEREEKTVVSDVEDYDLTADGKKLLVIKGRTAAIIDLKEGGKLDKKLRTAEMEATVDPRAEWKQVFTDAWRLERDYFYDPAMHGVDWAKIRTRYGALLDQAVTRWDVNFVIGEMIAELNASHTYRGGGAVETPKNVNVGYLGVDWAVDNGGYRIKRIVRGAPWDVEARSPLDVPGVGVKEGEYVLAVNGVPMDPKRDPYAAFQGTGGEPVELLVNGSPDAEGARRVIVQTLASESRLRYLEWVERSRQRVDAASGGTIGYVYVPNTGTDGQSELVRQFAAQFHKQGLIIDERFNSGGQIPDRFIELLNRPPLAFWAIREGQSWQWPPVAHFGHKAMLINGWSGSGGDAFPDYFRKAGLGPLIGERTWGGLIGISGAPALIDGGNVTVPTFRMYNPDGTWFKEGHGVDPDIEVTDDPSAMAVGKDPQLDRAVDEVLSRIRQKPPVLPAHPPYEKR